LTSIATEYVDDGYRLLFRQNASEKAQLTNPNTNTNSDPDHNPNPNLTLALALALALTLTCLQHPFRNVGIAAVDIAVASRR